MKQETKKEVAVIEAVGFSINPKNLDEAMKCCELLAKSDFVPKDYVGKPGNVMVAIQMGQEVGLKPLQALQSIAVINGRPAMFGDAVVAIVRGSGTVEYLEETWDEKTQTAVCKGKRKGEPKEIVRTFSMEDAKKAGLLDRSTTWKTYPKRMAGWRAKSWVLRDGWADYLKGIAIREEVEDIPTNDKPEIKLPKAVEAEVVQTAPVDPPVPEPVETEEPVKPAAPPKKTADDILTASVTKVTRNKASQRYTVTLKESLVGVEWKLYTMDTALAQKASGVMDDGTTAEFKFKKIADGYELVSMEIAF